MANGSLDILGRKPQVIGRAYSSDAFQIAISGPNHDFMLVQNLTIAYAQNVTRLFDLENSEFQAYVASRPQGQMTLANVVTNLDSMVTFMQTYGDVCQADTNKNIVISITGRGSGSLCKAEGGSISLSHPVLTSSTLSLSVADYIISNQMGFIFASENSGGSTRQ